MNRTQVAGSTGIGICITILPIIFAPIVLAIIAGCIIGTLVYAMLLATPAAYHDEDQEITEDGILFVYYGV